MTSKNLLLTQDLFACIVDYLCLKGEITMGRQWLQVWSALEGAMPAASVPDIDCGNTTT